MFLYWRNPTNHESKCSHSELFTLFFSKENTYTKSKAENITFEMGLHVPGGCPRAYPTQEASLSTVKAVPFDVNYS